VQVKRASNGKRDRAFRNGQEILFLKRRRRDLPRIEGLQVIRLLPEANKFNRQPQFLFES